MLYGRLRHGCGASLYYAHYLQDERTPIHWAASSGSLDIVRYLIDQQAEVNKVDNSGWTPLHIAGNKLNLIYSS